MRCVDVYKPSLRHTEVHLNAVPTSHNLEYCRLCACQSYSLHRNMGRLAPDCIVYRGRAPIVDSHGSWCYSIAPRSCAVGEFSVWLCLNTGGNTVRCAVPCVAALLEWLKHKGHAETKHAHRSTSRRHFAAASTACGVHNYMCCCCAHILPYIQLGHPCTLYALLCLTAQI